MDIRADRSRPYCIHHLNSEIEQLQQKQAYKQQEWMRIIERDRMIRQEEISRRVQLAVHVALDQYDDHDMEDWDHWPDTWNSTR